MPSNVIWLVLLLLVLAIVIALVMRGRRGSSNHEIDADAAYQRPAGDLGAAAAAGAAGLAGAAGSRAAGMPGASVPAEADSASDVLWAEPAVASHSEPEPEYAGDAASEFAPDVVESDVAETFEQAGLLESSEPDVEADPGVAPAAEEGVSDDEVLESTPLGVLEPVEGDDVETLRRCRTLRRWRTLGSCRTLRRCRGHRGA
ncbi:MAG: hypothetical protein V9G15_03315 [Dermatophilaceae bacterium]